MCFGRGPAAAFLLLPPSLEPLEKEDEEEAVAAGAGIKDSCCPAGPGSAATDAAEGRAAARCSCSFLEDGCLRKDGGDRRPRRPNHRGGDDPEKPRQP